MKEELEAAVREAIGTVIDPEIGLDIITLGLVYDVRIDGSSAEITYTLTTPGCPMEGYITSGIRNAVTQVAGITEVRTRLVWEPAWSPEQIREGAW